MTRPSSVFIVEDEAIIAMEIEDHLRTMGYTFAGRAAHAEQALVRIPDLKPDVVLVDVNLGAGMSGTELTERLKDVYQVPCIYLTAYSDPELVERAIKSRSFAYIVKPFQPETLRANIEMALHVRSVERDLERSNAMLRATLDATADGLFVVDREGRVTAASRTLVESWGIPEAIAGTPAMLETMASRLVAPGDRDARRLATEVGPGAVCVLERDDGRAFQRRARPLVVGGEEQGRVVSLLDVTEARERVRLEAEAKYRDELFAELNHRVKNNLQSLASLLRLRFADVDDPAIRDMLAASISRIQAIAMLHDQLGGSKVGQAADAEGYLAALVEALRALHGAPEIVSIELGRVDALALDADALMNVGMITAELLLNALRHAFPRGRSGKVVVTLVSVGAAVELTVRDDGVGATQPSSTPTLGMRIVRSLAERLAGSFSIETSGEGTRASVRFAPPSVAQARAGTGPT